MRRWHLVLATALLVGCAYLSLAVGVVPIPLTDMWHPSEQQWQLLTLSRLPRMVAILLAGASMAVAGLIMQRLTQNSFVSPSTAGTVEAAVLGILVATLWLPVTSVLGTMAVAIAFAIVGTMVFLFILGHVRVADPVVVALLGLMYGGVIAAVTVFIAYERDLLQLLEIWTTGSFSAIMPGQYEPIYIVLIAGLFGFLYADRFAVAGMGREFAVNLGLNYPSVRAIGLVIVSVIAAVVVVVVGAIPFLGLIVPNVVTLAMGDNLRRVLPVTALAGAAFVLICDVIGRTVRYPYEIPVSTIAGIIGALVFLWMILRTGERARG
ncbi:MAG: iron chelate uptake ABC transporter family permease subunit [Ornithinimicrobium sp.]